LKPNCYKCIHRRSIPGDRHSSCHHPDNGFNMDSCFASILMILGKYAGIAEYNKSSSLEIIGNEHGIKNHWFLWPFNYDPIWLIQCKGYTEGNGSE